MCRPSLSDQLTEKDKRSNSYQENSSDNNKFQTHESDNEAKVKESTSNDLKSLNEQYKRNSNNKSWRRDNIFNKNTSENRLRRSSNIVEDKRDIHNNNYHKKDDVNLSLFNYYDLNAGLIEHKMENDNDGLYIYTNKIA